MVRFARNRRVFFVEEPVFEDIEAAEHRRRHARRRLGRRAAPAARLRRRSGPIDAQRAGARRPDRARRPDATTSSGTTRRWRCASPTTCGRLPSSTTAWTSCRRSRAPPSELPELERRLMARADLVFTGGQSLYEAKKAPASQHPCDAEQRRRGALRVGAALAPPSPPDQRDIPRPRLGFFGVIDERLDIALLAGLAEARPDWQFVMIGPVVKIDPGELPRPRQHPLPRRRSRTPSCRATSPAGTSRCCRSPATRRRASSARPRRPSISPPASRSCRRRSATSSRRTASAGLVAHRRHRARDGAGVRRRRCASRATARQARADAFLRGMSWDATWQRIDALLAAATACPSIPHSRASPPSRAAPERGRTCSTTWSSEPASPAPRSPSVSPITPASAC